MRDASLCFIVGNIDDAHKEHHKRYAAQALADNHFTQPEVRLIQMRMGPGICAFNAGHVFGKNSADAQDYSESLAFGRRMALEHVEFLRKYVPGYEKCILVATAPLPGVRETRRIIGEYELTWGDFADARHFPDQIGVYAKEVDIHPHSLDPEEFEKNRAFREAKAGWLPKGASYGIPYGVIVPRGWKNLWVAGRAASFDEIVYGSARVMPACSMMGEAAGAAAVQALRTGQTADQLDTAALVEQLRRQGAYLPQQILSSEMTRGRGAERPSNPLCPVLDTDDVRPRKSAATTPAPAAPIPAPAPTSRVTDGAESTNPMPEELSDLLMRVAREIDRTCCRTLFEDADEYCAELIEATHQTRGDTAALGQLLRDVTERLETGCCQSGLSLNPADLRCRLE